MSAPPMSLGSEDNFEDALWSNDFYSSAAGISQLSLLNHIYNLRKTVNIPNSMLSNLISTGLLGAAEVAAVENTASRTLLMKVSPSMKALESVLNGKASSSPAQIIPEEEETGDSTTPLPVVVPFAPSKRGSVLFAQALNHARLAETASSHHHSLSISTIEESGYSTSEPTPTLDQPATFHTIKCLSKDYLPQLKTIDHSFPEKEVDSGDTKVSVGEDVSEHDDTLFEDRVEEEKARDATNLNSALASAAKDSSAENLPSPIVEEFHPTVPAAVSLGMSKVKSMLDVAPETNSEGAAKTEPSSKVSAANSVPHPGITSVQKQAPSPRINHTPVTTPKLRSASFTKPGTPLSQQTPKLARSPHQRSLSEIAAEGPSPRHRRSNTVGDIAGLAKDSSSKRFSFRGLFKIKSKNHSLDKLKAVNEEPSQPKKITSKSFSTPNFGLLVEEKEEKSKTAKNKESRRSIFGMKKKKPAFLATQIEDTKLDGESSTIVNDKNSNVAPLYPGKYKDTPATPVTYSSQTFESGTMGSGGTPATNTLHEESHTIREVDDSDYHPNAFPDISEASSDENSLQHDPPKRMDGGKYGEEVLLEPLDSSSPNLLLAGFSPRPNSFGSPFALSYNSRQSSPQRLRTPNEQSPQKDSLSPRFAQLLAGEVLFPKSLLAQEVESIVSLERSRSMRSVRSGKRSSFINYTGSDENIIIADSSSQNVSGMKRSGSILKKSQSISSIIAPLIDASLDAAANLQNITGTDPSTVEKNEPLSLAPPLEPLSQHNDDDYEFENFTDLIEFSDFIDIDNLDFTSSPIQNSLSSKEFGLIDTHHATDISKHHEPEPAMENHQEKSEVELESLANEPLGEIPIVRVEPCETPLVDEGNAPDVIVVDSSGLEPEVPQTPPRESMVVHDTPDSLCKSPILDNAYKMAIADLETRKGTASARPISMSFRGFSGSTLKNQQFVQSGSHQLLQLNESKLFESLAVGEGFGSSDDEDDDEDFDDENGVNNSFSQAEHDDQFGNNGLKATNSSARRAQAQALKYTGFQPPPLASVPFHHDRFPLISDQSNGSSPRLFSSLMSRIRKSPLTLPRPTAKKSVQFSSRILLYDTFDGDEYDRHPDIATCNQLTPKLAQQIREELNEFKKMMVVHEDSRCNTYFF